MKGIGDSGAYLDACLELRCDRRFPVTDGTLRGAVTNPEIKNESKKSRCSFLCARDCRYLVQMLENTSIYVVTTGLPAHNPGITEDRQIFQKVDLCSRLILVHAVSMTTSWCIFMTPPWCISTPRSRFQNHAVGP